MNRRDLLKFGGVSVVAASTAACAGSPLGGSSDNERFFEAIRQNDARAMRNLLKAGVDPNSVNAQGDPGLFWALKEGSLDVAQVLIQAPGIHLNQLNKAGESPLMIAALKGETPIAKELIKQGAAIDKDGWTPLHYAVTGEDLDIVKLLLSYGVNVNARSPNGTTPLMMAARYGNEAGAKLLLEHGADPTLKNQLGLTAVDFAKRSDRQSMVNLITAAIQKGSGGATGGH